MFNKLLINKALTQRVSLVLERHCVTLTETCCFNKRNLAMHVNTSHKTAVLVKPRHILQRKCPLVFPLMSYDCSVCLQPFIQWGCHQQLTAAAASVCRQPTCCFQEPSWITELKQSSRGTSEGKPENIFSVKYDQVLLQLLLCATH